MIRHRLGIATVFGALGFGLFSLFSACDSPAFASGDADSALLTQDQIKRAYTYFNCADELVMCVDVKGNPLPAPDRKRDAGDNTIRTVKAVPRPSPTDTLLYLVLGNPDGRELAGKTLKLEAAGQSGRAERRFSSAPGSAAGDADTSAPETGSTEDPDASDDTELVASDTLELQQAQSEQGAAVSTAAKANPIERPVFTRKALEAEAKVLIAKVRLAVLRAKRASRRAHHASQRAKKTGLSDGGCEASASCMAILTSNRIGETQSTLDQLVVLNRTLKSATTEQANITLTQMRTLEGQAEQAAETADNAADGTAVAALVGEDAGSDAAAVVENDAATADAGTASEVAAAPAPAKEDLQRLLLASLTITTPDAPSFTIQCRLETATTTELCGTQLITIDSKAPYHFEVMLSAAMIFSGDRTVGLDSIAGSNQKVLGVKEDLEVAPAIGFHYFPFGVRGAGAWVEGPAELNRPSNVPTPLRVLYHFLIKPWGLEIGTALNRQVLRNVQAGLAFEPVRGGSVSFGFSALQGDFLQPGWARGMLYPENTPLPVDNRFMFRPYLGFSVSPELLTLLLSALESAQHISPPAGRQPETDRSN